MFSHSMKKFSKVFAGVLLPFVLTLVCRGQTPAPTGQTASPTAQRTFRHSGKITVKTIDKKQDLKAMWLEPMPVPAPEGKKYAVSMSTSFTYSGDVPLLPNSLSLRFRIENWEQVFPNRPKVSLTYDGETVLIPWLGSDKKSSVGAAISGWEPSSNPMKKGEDWLLIAIPLDLLVKLLNAKQVSISNDKVELHLSEENLEALRDFFTRGQ